MVLTTGLAGSARADGPTWYRVAASAGVSAYRTLATSTSSASWSTTVDHGGDTGTYRFSPSNTVTTTTSGPGQTPSGQG